MQQIFSDSTSGKYQKPYTALKLEEIEESEYFYTSKTPRELYCENTKLPKEFPSLTSKKAAANVCHPHTKSVLIVVSQLPHLRIRKHTIFSGAVTQLRLPVKVHIAVSCYYVVWYVL